MVWWCCLFLLLKCTVCVTLFWNTDLLLLFLLQEGDFLLERFAAITSSIHKLLECPVCLELVSAPVKMCINGHMTCSSCASKLSQCSLCQNPFLQLNSTVLNNLLEVVPKFCKFLDNGCKEVFVAGDDHEQFCGHRFISCKNNSCDDRVKVMDFREHYEVKHPSYSILTQTKGTLHLTNFDKNKDERRVKVMEIDGVLCYIYFQNCTKEKQVKICFLVFPMRKLDGHYYLTTKFENGDVVNCKTIRSIEITGDNDIDDFDPVCEEYTWEDFYMTVSTSLIHHLLDDEKHLYLTYTVLKL